MKRDKGNNSLFRNWMVPSEETRIPVAKRGVFVFPKELYMKFYCYKKCSTCKKAAAFLGSRGLQFEMIDYIEQPLTAEELRAYWQASNLPLKKFFNTSGMLYRELCIKDRLPDMTEDEQLELLATNPMLVKRPILVLGQTVLVGFNEQQWGKLATQDNTLQVSHELYKRFANIQYGKMDKYGRVYHYSDEDFSRQKFLDYRLQTPEQVEQNQVGVCWDQVEYARMLFNQAGIPTKTYAIMYCDYENSNYYNHTILVFRSENKYYWFEHSMATSAGIHEFDSLESLLLKLKDEFLAHTAQIPKRYVPDRLRLWEYEALEPRSDPLAIFKAWEESRNLDYIIQKSGENT